MTGRRLHLLAAILAPAVACQDPPRTPAVQPPIQVGQHLCLGPSPQDQARAVVDVPDGWVVVGTVRGPSGNPRAQVTRLTASGARVWDWRAPTQGESALHAVTQGPEGLTAVGRRLAPGTQGSDTWWLRLDLAGRVTAERLHPVAQGDEALALARASDGGTYVAGWAAVLLDRRQRAGRVLRLDESGQVLWSQLVVEGEDAALQAVAAVPGGVLAAGAVAHHDETQRVLACRWDAEGNLLWSQTFTAPGDAQALAMAPLSDGGAVLAGTVRGPLEGPARHQGLLVWIDAKGQEIRRSLLATVDGGLHAVQVLPAGDMVVAGRDEGSQGHGQLLLAALHGDGTVRWRKAFGSPDEDMGHAVRVTAERIAAVGGGHFRLILADLDGQAPAEAEPDEEETVGPELCSLDDPRDCDDGNVCTQDLCYPPTGCEHLPTPYALKCGPGLVCDGSDCGGP